MHLMVLVTHTTITTLFKTSSTYMYSTISYHTLIDYIHNTQPVLRIISSLLYMPDYECWLDSNCQMNLITLQQDDLKGRMCWLVLNTTSTHTYIHRYGLLWITNSSTINTYCVIPILYNILYPLYTLSDCWYMIEWRREKISSSCLWIEYIENMIIITCLWMDEMPLHYFLHPIQITIHSAYFTYSFTNHLSFQPSVVDNYNNRYWCIKRKCTWYELFIPCLELITRMLRVYD